MILAADSVDVLTVLMGLFGGLALFLYGLDQMGDALQLVAGARMKKLLNRLTSNRFKAAFAGAFVTAVVQSSSVTTVLVVGFVSAGLMSVAQSVGVIMGANIGTTVTAQIIAFKVTHYALIPVAIGFAMLYIGRHEQIRHYGRVLMGLGLIFFGLQLMSDGTSPLRTYQPFIDLLQRMDHPLLAIVVGAAFTALVQSSSATTGIIIVLIGQGLVSLEAGIALVFGANIGTCITAMLASIGKPREAVRAAVVHVLFNVAGVALWFAFIDPLAALCRYLSPSAPETGALVADTPRQIANAHTIFNVANTLLFIGFTGPLGSLAYRLVPDRRVAVRRTHLDDILLRAPDVAMQMVQLEIHRLGDSVLGMLHGSFDAAVSGDARSLERLRQQDNEVDKIHADVVQYLGKLSRENLSADLTVRLREALAIANHLENIGDMVEINLTEAGAKRLSHGLEISESTRGLLRELHRAVTRAVEQAVTAMVNDDRDIAREVLASKPAISRLADRAHEQVAARLAADAPHRLSAFEVESDLIENMKRIYYFAKRIAKVVGNHADAETEPGTEPEAVPPNDEDGSPKKPPPAPETPEQ